MNLRTAATSVFGFILLAMASGLISANVRKLADKHGWDNLLVRSTEKLSWERLRGLWWLWSIFGLSGGVALALWIAPQLGLPEPIDPRVAILTDKVTNLTNDNAATNHQLTDERAEVTDLTGKNADLSRQLEDEHAKVTTLSNANAAMYMALYLAL